ncbi:Na/Pi symporter [Salinibacillus xinjiangensis]|nr:Na/Pi symporter [Salinibacillus xinjiangensis]
MIYIIAFILFLGSFIFGMYLLRSGLFNLSSDTVRKWLITLTDTPLKGILIGILVTVIFQNSAVVIMVTVGLIAAGLLTFRQSLGIILGTNIGSSITVEIITIDLGAYVLPMALIGSILCYVKNNNVIRFGYTLIGLSLVFGAMWGLEMIAAQIKDLDGVLGLLVYLDDHRFYALLIGAIFTVLIQSNTAVTGMTMSFLSVGAMDLATCITFILGGYIGICVIALVATIGSGKEARHAVFAYMWLNILGVLMFYPFTHLLASIGSALSNSPETQLAHSNLIFTLFVTLLILPLANQFQKLIQYIHRY